MATPHVAGVALYLMAKDHISGPGTVTKRILNMAKDGMTSVSAGTTKKYVYNGAH